jgi:hypothetical protein
MQIREKFIELIEANELRKRTRKRRFVNQRCYMIRLMRDHGLTYMDIGELIGLDYSTCIYSYKRGEQWELMKDKYYFVDTEHLRSSLDNIQISRTLIDLHSDIQQAGSVKDLETIKERIKRNEYKIKFINEEQILN